MRRTRRVATSRVVRVLATLAVLLGLASPAAARQMYGERPMLLPAWPTHPRAARVHHAGWLLGARHGRAADVLARRFGAARLRMAGAFRVPEDRARAMARALDRAGLLLYAEPDVRVRRATLVEGAPDGWARGVVVPLTQAPPPPGTSIGVIDDFVDPGNPDVGPQTRYLNPGAGVQVSGPHGTAVASVAAGAANGSGVLGILPGAPITSYGMPTEFTCADVADGIEAEVAAGVRIINLSLGGSDCFTMFRAVQRAYAAGGLIVAAAGNEFLSGNPIVFPAAYPHVLTVGAVGPDLRPSAFSSANLAVDVAAPGQQVPVAVPLAFDTEDGAADGVTLADGTSFASPMVAGAAAWLTTVRHGLTNGQVADLLRFSAIDLPPAGYDRDSGFGLINLPRALAAPTPRPDPMEPNDGITFVDGTAFGRAEPPVWRGYGHRVIHATADVAEDPVDVYRIRVPGRFAFRIRVRPTYGDPDLRVYSSAARSIQDERRIVARSTRPNRRSEVVHLVNRTRSARSTYVMITIGEDATQLDTSYRLDLERVRLSRRDK